jgi:hypothetical protein
MLSLMATLVTVLDGLLKPFRWLKDKARSSSTSPIPPRLRLVIDPHMTWWHSAAGETVAQCVWHVTSPGLISNHVKTAYFKWPKVFGFVNYPTTNDGWEFGTVHTTFVLPEPPGGARVRRLVTLYDDFGRRYVRLVVLRRQSG